MAAASSSPTPGASSSQLATFVDEEEIVEGVLGGRRGHKKGVGRLLPQSVFTFLRPRPSSSSQCHPVASSDPTSQPATREDIQMLAGRLDKTDARVEKIAGVVFKTPADPESDSSTDSK